MNDREETIKELKEYEDGLDLEYATPFDKAVLRVIKELEQEPRPYKAEKPETCKGCLELCIMYEPNMRACKKKVTKSGKLSGSHDPET